MQQLYLANPRKRKRRAKARKSSRKASPAQLRARARFAAMARSRSRKRRASSAAPARRRRVRRNPIGANPAVRRHRRRVARTARRSSRRVRRNPIAIRGLLNQAIGYAKDAAFGAAGAVAIDVAMAQTLKVLPDTFSAKVASRTTLEGGVNWGYYAVKSGLAVAVGALAGAFLPGRMKRAVAVGVQGSFMVQGYEIARAVMPADMVTLAYYSPAAVQAVSGPGNVPVGQARSLSYYPGGRLARSGPAMDMNAQRIGHSVIGG